MAFGGGGRNLSKWTTLSTETDSSTSTPSDSLTALFVVSACDGSPSNDCGVPRTAAVGVIPENHQRTNTKLES